ncbi:MAG: rhodanese-like domain-containing protein [Betaproteobacteria bacterium]|nr:rhodanese-like domain-containing protein [Betaproteobacteria bacterium]
MGRLSDLLALAQERTLELELPYKGALTPREAYEVVQLAPGAKLVDVRTRAELDWVGRIPGAIEIEWLHYPSNALNEHFIPQLRQQVNPQSLVLFICRSGVRSYAAAIAAIGAGYESSYNVLEGFEGDKDSSGQRNNLGGWRYAGLPWTQS